MKNETVYEWLELNLKWDYENIDVEKEFAISNSGSDKIKVFKTLSEEYNNDEFKEKIQPLVDFLNTAKATQEFLLDDMKRMKLRYQAKDRLS